MWTMRIRESRNVTPLVEDKTTTLIQGTGSNYKSKAVLIGESGLYALVLSSKLPHTLDYMAMLEGWGRLGGVISLVSLLSLTKVIMLIGCFFLTFVAVKTDSINKYIKYAS